MEFLLGILWLIGYVVTIAIALALVALLVCTSLFMLGHARRLMPQVYVARLHETEADEREVRLVIRNVGGAPAFNVALGPAPPDREKLARAEGVDVGRRSFPVLGPGEERQIVLGSAAALRGAIGRDTASLGFRWSGRPMREGRERYFTISVVGE